jgi:hypothetical protein
MITLKQYLDDRGISRPETTVEQEMRAKREQAQAHRAAVDERLCVWSVVDFFTNLRFLLTYEQRLVTQEKQTVARLFMLERQEKESEARAVREQLLHISWTLADARAATAAAASVGALPDLAETAPEYAEKRARYFEWIKLEVQQDPHFQPKLDAYLKK